MTYYTKDFKEKVIVYANKHTAKATCEVFGIGMRTVFRWKKKLRDTGNLNRAPLNRKFRKLDPEKLVEYVKAHPDAYVWEIAEHCAVSPACVDKALKKQKITLKKKRGPTRSGMRRGVRSIRGSYPSTKKKT
jgi:transposase